MRKGIFAKPFWALRALAFDWIIYLITVPELGIFYVLDFRYRVNFTQLSNGFFHTCLGVFGGVGVRISIEIIGSPKAFMRVILRLTCNYIIYNFNIIYNLINKIFVVSMWERAWKRFSCLIIAIINSFVLASALHFLFGFAVNAWLVDFAHEFIDRIRISPLSMFTQCLRHIIMATRNTQSRVVYSWTLCWDLFKTL